MATGTFLRAWIASPRQVGAIVPSSPHLAKLITRDMSRATGRVLELGPGTGVFTQMLVDRGIRQEDLTLVELNDTFADLLADRYPGAVVVRCDASRLSSGGIAVDTEYGAVVSGLPLLAMPFRAVFRIVRGATERLAPSGSLYQFTYGMRCPVPDAVLDRLALRAEKAGTVLSNFPPASVYRITRQ